MRPNAMHDSSRLTRDFSLLYHGVFELQVRPGKQNAHQFCLVQVNSFRKCKTQSTSMKIGRNLVVWALLVSTTEVSTNLSSNKPWRRLGQEDADQCAFHPNRKSFRQKAITNSAAKTAADVLALLTYAVEFAYTDHDFYDGYAECRTVQRAFPPSRLPDDLFHKVELFLKSTPLKELTYTACGHRMAHRK